jgi:hypothetical protein
VGLRQTGSAIIDVRASNPSSGTVLAVKLPRHDRKVRDEDIERVCYLRGS